MLSHIYVAVKLEVERKSGSPSLRQVVAQLYIAWVESETLISPRSFSRACFSKDTQTPNIVRATLLGVNIRAERVRFCWFGLVWFPSVPTQKACTTASTSSTLMHCIPPAVRIGEELPGRRVT